MGDQDLCVLDPGKDKSNQDASPNPVPSPIFTIRRRYYSSVPSMSNTADSWLKSRLDIILYAFPIIFTRVVRT